ncbi:TPA: S6 family peptidase [Escherichia coli]|uniref:S6 family peptidase n=2 Tax=Escherichia coli TaxID=562 RepID=UPI000E20C101|nr:S6 family peptidase [Escherichia coli]EFH9364361.1 hypothetical protein [Escherichia coli]EJV7210351.1 hypothetical protein [Escherichia coli]MCG3993561.1 hypothetical protein [Escherichia coli]MCN5161791.1 hypothetical protein [Escherichia coli]MCV1143906.1 ESPR-type extended signal peptide-containing protein [Escherichia coli]
MNKIYSLKYSHITGGLVAVSELSKKIKKNSRAKKLIALAITGITSLTLSSPTLSAIVRNDIPYQTFRDFAENKGEFSVGNTNIAIKNNAGQIIGYLDKAPMPDFSSVSVLTTSLVPGAHTLYSPQYIVTARHVNASSNTATQASFGYTNNAYTIISTLNHNSGLADIKTLRLNKLVTEVAPATVSTQGTVNNAYNKTGVYTAFYRVGGGNKFVKDASGKTTPVSGSFLIGGTIGHLSSYNQNLMIASDTASLFNTTRQGPLANYSIIGDSGSPLFGFNSKTQQWELVGVESSMTSIGNNWAVTSKDFLSKQPENDFDKTITHTDTSSPLVWTYNAKNGEIKDQKNTYQMHSGKNLYFTGKDGRIDLQNTVNQGAGYLQFSDSYTLSTSNGSTWIGGGVIVEDDATVNWGVNGVAGDNLHKVGSGTLIINGTGENKGGLKIGDGTVVLEQKASTDNKQQAFSNINIASGRGTVRINGENQVNPDNISWGYKGGKLDLNGHDLSFTRLQADDFGAVIANDNQEKNQRSILNYLH